MDKSLETILANIPQDGINLRELYNLTCDKVKSRDCWGMYFELLKRQELVKEYNTPNGTNVKRVK